MKKMVITFILLLFLSCSIDDENNNSTTPTDIALVTGINIRSSSFSAPIQLGNPNVFTNNQFIAYPNPPTGALSVSASQNISDVWIIPANGMKIYQQEDFSSILNSDLYTEPIVESNAEMEFTNLDTPDIILNLDQLTAGYYRVYVKIGGILYWDNIYIPDGNFVIDDLINFWN